jgi:hypothetical protein
VLGLNALQVQSEVFCPQKLHPQEQVSPGPGLAAQLLPSGQLALHPPSAA